MKDISLSLSTQGVSGELSTSLTIVHSIFGLIILSAVFFIILENKTIYFSIAYLLHLLLDWTDIDEKYYLYPLRIKFKGFLPIWSKLEKIFTIAPIFLILILLLNI